MIGSYPFGVLFTNPPWGEKNILFSVTATEHDFFL
jgi:hypothetical protein